MFDLGREGKEGGDDGCDTTTTVVVVDEVGLVRREWKLGLLRTVSRTQWAVGSGLVGMGMERGRAGGEGALRGGCQCGGGLTGLLGLVLELT